MVVDLKMYLIVAEKTIYFMVADFMVAQKIMVKYLRKVRFMRIRFMIDQQIMEDFVMIMYPPVMKASFVY